MRLRSSFETERMDLSGMPEVVRLVLDQLRNLSFEGGAAIHPRSGVRLEGFANLSGSHPRVDSEYTIVTVVEKLPELSESDLVELGLLDDTDRASYSRGIQELHEQRRATARSQGTIQEVHEITNVQLTADDRRRFSFDVSSTGTNPFAAGVRIEPPARPTKVHVDVTAAATGHWFVAGRVKVDAQIDIEPLTRIGAGTTSILEVSGRHRRGRATVEIAVADTGLGMWNVDVAVHARGAGWFRPIAAVVALVGRRWLQRGLDKMARSDSEIVKEVRAGLAEIPEKSPAVFADEFIDETFDGVVETLPPVLLR